MMRLLLMAGSRLPAGMRVGVAVVCLAAVSAHAQLVHAKDGETLPAFEVASVRQDTSGSGNTSISYQNDSYRAENVTLRNLIMNAWQMRSESQLKGGPDQLLNEHFDINAKVSEDDRSRMAKLSREDRSRQNDLILQSMLIDRFGLKVHYETKELPVFALVVTKGGPKFHAAAPDPPPDNAKSAAPPAPGDTPAPSHHSGTSMHIDNKGAELDATDTPVESLARMIAFQSETEGRPVIDKTGLTGNFDYSLKWTPDSMAASAKATDNAATSSDTGASGPSLFTALQDQLGLKLEPEKAPVEILVIDHVEQPSAN
jgi:uncharacterized protein (TIGR03435 family)